MLRVLNVGGGRDRSLPPHYDGWEQHVLDIDPAADPDICADAMEMRSLPAGQYDAVFCSHNLEHFHRHEVPRVLRGFLHVLKRQGFAEIVVPDIMGLAKALVEGGKDIEDVWYETGNGIGIRFLDVVYGWGRHIEIGNEFYCHKTAFSMKSLGAVLQLVGFGDVVYESNGYDIRMFAFIAKPSSEMLARLGIPCPSP